ncbi:MAG: hypothetical protein ACFE8A_13360 [Candidatus Hodarchaeota archaeon]
MEKIEKMSEEELLKLYKDNKQKITETIDEIEKLKEELASKGD